MTSFNKIKKIKYTKNPTDVVALKEYIVFADDNAEEKYAVFKFVNNLNQRLTAIKFEVSQYDADGELIEKSTVAYDNFTVGMNEEFVPNAKLKLNFNCSEISERLIFAAFDRVKWENGEFTDNSYKFSAYAATTPQPAPQPQKAAAVIPEAKTPDKKAEKYVPFRVKETAHKNAAVFPRVFNVFVCILLIAFVAVTLVLFTRNSKVYTVKGFDLKTDGDYVVVCGYDGTEKDVKITAEIGGKKVKKIGSGAFKNSGITSVYLEVGVDIDKDAFVNCNSLKSVKSSYTADSFTVYGEAFKNCKSLSDIDMPTATLSAGAFSGVKNLKNVSVNGCTATTFASVFGAQNGEYAEVKLNVNKLTGAFFDGVKVGNLVLRNDDCVREFGAFKNVTRLNGTALDYRVLNDCVEVVGGRVTAVKPGVKEFTVPTDVDFDASAFTAELSGVTKLTADSIDRVNLNFYPSVNELTVPWDSYLCQFVSYSSIMKLVITSGWISSDIKLPDNIRDVTLKSGVTCAYNMLSNNYYLEKLVFEDGVNGLNKGTIIGTNCPALKTVVVTLNNLEYKNFNQSYEYTENLKLKTNIIDGENFSEMYNLKRLEIDAAAAINCKLADKLAECPNLETLVLNAPEIGAATVGETTLNVRNLYLLNVNKLPKDFFKSFGYIEKVYIPDTLVYDYELIDMLNAANIGRVCFEGSFNGNTLKHNYVSNAKFDVEF